MVKWYAAGREITRAPRIKFTYDKESGVATLEVKKCKDRDEAKYKCELCDAEGHAIDYAGFSVFVKGKLFFM